MDIETVVIFLVENRSFDHYFGTRSLEEGLVVDGLAAAMSNARPDGPWFRPSSGSDLDDWQESLDSTC